MGIALPLITIDGPAGSGKSTLCKLLAAHLGLTCLDTGAMYRVVAWYLRQQEKEHLSGEALALFLSPFDFRIEGQGPEQQVWAEGRDISQEIRTPEMSWWASVVSAKPEVRSFLLERQRAFGQRGGLVAEGRDMGTVIFPGADVKFFLSASIPVRARRRYEELIARGQSVSLEQVQQDMEERDRQDEQRALAPLRPAQGAVIIDSSSLTIGQVIEKMLTVIKGKELKKDLD
jgi:cytidylate kinase